MGAAHLQTSDANQRRLFSICEHPGRYTKRPRTDPSGYESDSHIEWSGPAGPRLRVTLPRSLWWAFVAAHNPVGPASSALPLSFRTTRGQQYEPGLIERSENCMKYRFTWCDAGSDGPACSTYGLGCIAGIGGVAGLTLAGRRQRV
jgi:hypothetical protein